MELLLGFVVAIGVTMALIPPLIKLAPRWRFVDLPQSRKVHANPIPRVGGIAMAVGVLLALSVTGGHWMANRALIAAMLVLLAFGMWDDRANLSAGIKLIGQALAVLIVMVFGDVAIGSFTLTDRMEMPKWLAYPITFVFLVGATNAINLADGLDGLAGGTTLMCLAGLALLAFTFDSPHIGGVSVFIIGAVVGFLRFNTYPARVFMGDTGSQLLGFTAAVLAVMLTQDQDVPLSSALPLLLLGVPLIDTLWVMTNRILAGQSPFKADRTHIHHRLLALGFDHHEAVMIIYVAQASFFALAWFMRYESDVLIIGSFVALAGALIVPLGVAKQRAWRWRAPATAGAASPSNLRRLTLWLADPDRLPLWSVWLIAVAIVAFALRAIAASEGFSSDVTFVAAGTAFALLTSTLLFRRADNISWIGKAALYLAITLIVFLHETSERTSFENWWAIVAVVIGVAIRMRLNHDRRFTVTPLDVLVVLIAALVPNLPNSVASPQALGSGVAKLVVLFYGIETLSIVAQRRWRLLTLGAAALLVSVVLKGM